MERLQKAITDIGGNENNCLAVACDVGKPTDVKALFAALKTKFGRIDVLFNNAGMGAPAIPMEELTYEQFLAKEAIYTTSCLRLIQPVKKVDDKLFNENHLGNELITQFEEKLFSNINP